MVAKSSAGVSEVIESLQATERELREARHAICGASRALTRSASAGVQIAAYDAGIVDTLHAEIEDLRVRIYRVRKRMQECQTQYTRQEHVTEDD